MTVSDLYEKILFRLTPDDEGWPPAEVESLWAARTPSGGYRLDNIPFFVRGVSCGDEVSVRDENGELWFDGVLRWNGHRTIRILVFDEEKVSVMREALADLGCTSELSHLPRLVAVDIPPSVDAGTLRAWLEHHVAQDEIDVEEGNVDW